LKTDIFLVKKILLFAGEGKLFGKSFPSPEPPSFQKLLKKG